MQITESENLGLRAAASELTRCASGASGGDKEEEAHAVFFSQKAFERLTLLALQHERSVGELLTHAVNMHYGDEAVNARLRVVARLARLEASLGDPDVLAEDLKQAVRHLLDERQRAASSGS